MMLLSRTAEDLYWLGRHVERAESLSRLIGEHTNLLVDLPMSSDSDWEDLLAVTGSRGDFSLRHSRAGEAEIVTFLMSDPSNPGSVVHSINAARETLRTVRPLVPRSAWECLNELNLHAIDDTALCAERQHRVQATERIMATCQRFSGILSGTMSRDHAYRFWRLGCLVERADMTTRVLDVGAGALLEASAPDRYPAADRRPHEDVRWLGVLRALAAHHMFHRSNGCPVSGPGVVEFLLADPAFPRSVRHCTVRMEQLLGELPSRPWLTPAFQSLARAAARSSAPVDPMALRLRVDEVQRSLESFRLALAHAFFAVPAPPAAVPQVSSV